MKEGRACGYCHTSGSPATINVASGQREPVDLNHRGMYYAKNGYSFAGYVEKIKPVVAPPPLFQFVERIALPDSARRIAVATVAGDNMPRLVTLNEKPDTKDSSVLTIQKWNGKAFVTEFHADTPGAPDKLAVGRFTQEGPTVILTSKALWYWNGKTYICKVAAQSVNLLGSVRYRRADGTEKVLVLKNSDEMWEYRVDVNVAAGGNYLTGGTHLEALPASQVMSIDMHNTPEGFEKLVLPQKFTAGGIMGLMTAKKTGRLLLYHVDLDQDIDVKNGNADGKPKFIVKSQGWIVGVDDPRVVSVINLFCTPRLAGNIYDVATESIYGDGASALLILTSEGPEKKGRSLYSYTMNVKASLNLNGTILPPSDSSVTPKAP